MGIRIGTFVDVKRGYRKLPAKWWHLIFNKITFKKTRIRKRTQKRKVVYNVNQNTGILEKLSGLKD
jgi:hypothetical protein